MAVHDTEPEFAPATPQRNPRHQRPRLSADRDRRTAVAGLKGLPFHGANPPVLLSLQRTVGNAAVAQLINASRDDAPSPLSVVGGESGRPLDPDTRSKMESHFGQDFSAVRIHTGPNAAESARAVGAKAYTVGEDIVLGPGHPGMDSRSGQQTMAHELTHVVQQRSGPVDGTPGPYGIRVSDPSDRFEREAERVAEAISTTTQPVRPGRDRLPTPPAQPVTGAPPLQRLSANPMKWRKGKNAETESEFKVGDIQSVDKGPTTDLYDTATTTLTKKNKPVEIDDDTDEAKNVISESASPKQLRKLLAFYVKRAGRDGNKAQIDAALIRADADAVIGALEVLKSLEGPKRQKLIRALKEDPKTAETKEVTRRELADSTDSAVIRERAMIEHFYDQGQEAFNQHKKAKLAHRRSVRNGRNNMGKPDDAALSAQLYGLAQKAKLSLDVVQRRREMAGTVVDKLIGLGRLPGTCRRLAGKVIGGVVGLVVQGATAGIMGAELRQDERGFVTGNLIGAVQDALTPAKWGTKGDEAPGKAGRYARTAVPEKGFPVKITFLNDIVGTIKRAKHEWKMRQSRFVWDKISAVLGLFNEAFLQNIINVAGWIGTYLSVIGAILAVAGAAGYGVGATPGAVIAWIGVGLAGIGLASAALKTAIETVRTSAAFLTAVWNEDAKYSNELQARTVSTSIDWVSSSAQTVTKGLSMGSGVIGATHALSQLPSAAKWGIEGPIYAGEFGAVAGTAVGSEAIPAVAEAVSPGMVGAYNKGFEPEKHAPDPAPERALAAPKTPDTMHAPTDTEVALEKAATAEKSDRKAAFESRKAQATGSIGLTNQRIGNVKARLGNVIAPVTKLADMFKSKSNAKKAKKAQSKANVVDMSELAPREGPSAEEGEGLVSSFNLALKSGMEMSQDVQCEIDDNERELKGAKLPSSK